METKSSTHEGLRDIEFPNDSIQLLSCQGLCPCCDLKCIQSVSKSPGVLIVLTFSSVQVQSYLSDQCNSAASPCKNKKRKPYPSKIQRWNRQKVPISIPEGRSWRLEAVFSPNHLGKPTRQTSNSKALHLYLGHTGRMWASKSLGSPTFQLCLLLSTWLLTQSDFHASCCFTR